MTCKCPECKDGCPVKLGKSKARGVCRGCQNGAHTKGSGSTLRIKAVKARRGRAA